MLKLSVYLVAVSLLSCSTPNNTTMTPGTNNTTAADGWVSLFNGSTTAGWHTYNKTGVAAPGKQRTVYCTSMLRPKKHPRLPKVAIL
jgi:hypothetical protein